MIPVTNVHVHRDEHRGMPVENPVTEPDPYHLVIPPVPPPVVMRGAVCNREENPDDKHDDSRCVHSQPGQPADIRGGFNRERDDTPDSSEDQCDSHNPPSIP